MSLLSQTGIQIRDLIYVYPFADQPDPRGEDYGYYLQPVGRPLRAFSRKLGAGEAFVQGKANLTVNYRIYINYRRGRPAAVSERMVLWHPEVSAFKPDGSKDPDTALDIQSVVCHADDGVCVIEAGRSF